MGKRWTMEELAGVSPKRFIQGLIVERKERLNPYTPLAEKLNDLYRWAEKNAPATPLREIPADTLTVVLRDYLGTIEAISSATAKRMIDAYLWSLKQLLYKPNVLLPETPMRNAIAEFVHSLNRKKLIENGAVEELVKFGYERFEALDLVEG